MKSKNNFENRRLPGEDIEEETCEFALLLFRIAREML